MNEDYCKFVTNEWHRPMDSHASRYTVSEEDLLAAIIAGLLRIKKFNFMEKLSEEACAAITSTTKQTLIETLSQHDDIDVVNREDDLFEKTRRLDYGTWLELIQKLFDKLLLLLKRIEAVHSVIVAAIEERVSVAASSNNGLTSSDSLENVTSLQGHTNAKDCLGAICDFAHGRCSSLIERKISDGSLERLTACEFTQLSTTVETFILRCEKISGRLGPHLKQVLQMQSNKFATRFHEERHKKLSSIIDIEQWKSLSSVSPDFQELVTQVAKGCDLGELKRATRSICTEKPLPYVLIGEERFVVVSTVVILVNMAIEYCQTANEVRTLSADLLTRLLDLLRQFNLRSQALLLRGEAVQVAGLKCITTRNLAICERSLRLTIKLLPAIKVHFGGILTSKQSAMTSHLDEMLTAYEEHCDKLQDKMLENAREQLAIFLSKWEARPPVPSPPFQSVIQYLGVVHGNLEDCLPLEGLLEFFEKIHKAFKDALRGHLKRLKIEPNGGPQHGWVCFAVSCDQDFPL